ncbi:MAG: hypothetical protein CMC08_04770 [Flavobacteriaceae bacterium]|nr:hypothetical protein [Flavobacteriaceae bacterium]
MRKWLIIFVLASFTQSCEEVVEIDLNESEPRLVVDASINLREDGTGNAVVKLTTTAPFFDSEIPVVSNAQVFVRDEFGTTYPFTYTENGVYTAAVTPVFNIDYTLDIMYGGQRYTATEELQSVVPIDFVEQRNDGGFDGESIELKAFFNDPPNEENFYFFEGLSDKGDEYDTLDDEFFDGNLIFGFYVVDDLETGDRVTFNLYGVDKQFFNFMFVLLQQGSDDGGGPFETQPATVRGNLVNVTDPDRFPLGYFRVSEVSSLEYIVQ